MESILVIVLLLATHAAAGTTAGEQPKREDACQSTGFAREINSYCRESVIAFVDVEGSGTAPGPCRVAAEPQLIMAGLTTAGLLASFASCRALALGGTPLEAACKGDQLATGKETGSLPGMGTNMYPSSALLGQNKDEPMADLPVDDLTEKHDGTIMAVSKDHVKPSPLPDSWNLAEIFTTGVVLHGYLTIMTAIFFSAAYKTTKFPRIFHVKSLEKTAQDDFQMLASAVYLQVSTISQALIFVTRWQEFRFNSIFSMSEQRSDPHVSVYNLSRNHDIGYSAFHSVRREGLPRFIITIILLGVLFSAIRPIQAAAPIINVELKFDPEGYVGWSHDLYTVGTSLSQLEFTSTRQKVLGQQTLPQEPPAWIHVNVSDATEWSKFIMRSDNYYLSAYENREATHSFEEAAGFFPGSIDFGVSGSYISLNGGRRNLTNLNLNMDSAKLALLILSRYKHGVSDPFLMKRALTIYELILGEGQRFTEVDTCIKDGWNSDCYLTRPHDLLVNWGILSCGILEGWEPNSRHADWWVRSRKETYRKALNKLQITEAQAAGLLRVLVIGKACEDNIKGVHCITSNDSSCSIRD